MIEDKKDRRGKLIEAQDGNGKPVLISMAAIDAVTDEGGLNVLYENKDMGGARRGAGDWYWAVSGYRFADAQCFSDGCQGCAHTNRDADGCQAGSAAAGERMPDGTVCAGVSPATGKPFYAAAADESLTMKWKDAMIAARKSTAHGLNGWRLPSRAELNVMYANRGRGALKGTFNETGSYPAGWYWSSTELNENRASARRFSDGCRGWGFRDNRFCVRLVRD